jgi:ketosteroid isomerase-like protein
MTTSVSDQSIVTDGDILDLFQRGQSSMAISRSGVVAAFIVLCGLIAMAAPPRGVSLSDDAATVAALDTEYQAAVKRNDAAAMDRILADDFVLVTGRGQTFTKADLLRDARARTSVYEHQEDTEQKVRVWGDTAVVTALLWLKGTNGDKPFDRKLWFSDTYVRTPSGWRYVFGQASLALP